VIIGLPPSRHAVYVKQQIVEGDEITLRWESDHSESGRAVACFHGGQCIGFIPEGYPWVGRLLAKGDSHRIRVTGFDNNDQGEFIGVEIEIAILNEDESSMDADAKCIISEIGDELRILAMVAAADGNVAAPERALLQDYAQLRARETGINPRAGEVQHAVRWAKRRAADSLDAAQIIGRLAQDRPSVLRTILDECELMAEIDGEVGQEERQIVTMLRNLLNQGLAAERNSRR
jgi:tellurite resistance protein